MNHYKIGGIVTWSSGAQESSTGRSFLRVIHDCHMKKSNGSKSLQQNPATNAIVRLWIYCLILPISLISLRWSQELTFPINLLWELLHRLFWYCSMLVFARWLCLHQSCIYNQQEHNLLRFQYLKKHCKIIDSVAK